MTVVVTRDVAARFHGFLSSCMLEIAPGVYTAPKMNRAVRERILAVLGDWFNELGGGGIVMTWKEALAAAGQQVAVLGSASYEMYECDGVILARKRPPAPDED
jgi:CRISPR-associated protein Cas2